MSAAKLRINSPVTGRIICLLLVLGALLSACGGKSTDANGIGFTNGKFDFLFVDESPIGANKAQLGLIDYNGGKAVRVELSGGGVPYIVIDASSLLGKAVQDLYEMQITIAVEHPSGEFYAVSGEIHAYSGTERRESIDPWSVYLPTKNPNIARAVLEGEGERFVPGAYNFFILTKKVDNALNAGEAPSNLIISEIRFFNAEGRELRVNPKAGFAAPEGFGIPDRSNLVAVDAETNIDRAEGSSKNWGQAVAISTLKNDGPLDPQLLTANAVITVYYSSEAPPELILQSWTDGAPGTAGWAKVAPAAVNDSGSTAQYLYEDLTAAFGADDFATYLDKLYIGDTGKELRVYSVTIGVLH
jgi:hypothetical protein